MKKARHPLAVQKYERAMKGYREIKRILVEELGFRDLAAYQKWVTDVRPHVQPTPEAIERLSPHAVDCRAFWKVCDELFRSDPVCNVAVIRLRSSRSERDVRSVARAGSTSPVLGSGSSRSERMASAAMLKNDAGNLDVVRQLTSFFGYGPLGHGE